MPIHFKYTPGNNLLYGTIEGQTSVEELGYGMCRMYAMLSEHLPQEVSVFKDIASAENWLLGEDKLALSSG